MVGSAVGLSTGVYDVTVTYDGSMMVSDTITKVSVITSVIVSSSVTYTVVCSSRDVTVTVIGTSVGGGGGGASG